MWIKNFVDRIAQNFAHPENNLLGKLVALVMVNSRGLENPFVLQYLNPKPEHRVLEIGFGPGLMIMEVATRAAHVSGIDYSAAMVAQASRRAATLIAQGRVDLRQGEAISLPYPDRAFDSAFAIHVMYFWDNPVAVLQEIHRVLKPGGKFIALVEDRTLMEADRVMESGVFHLHTADEYHALFEQAGFAITEVHHHPEKRSFLAVVGMKAG